MLNRSVTVRQMMMIHETKSDYSWECNVTIVAQNLNQPGYVSYVSLFQYMQHNKPIVDHIWP